MFAVGGVDPATTGCTHSRAAWRARRRANSLTPFATLCSPGLVRCDLLIPGTVPSRLATGHWNKVATLFLRLTRSAEVGQYRSSIGAVFGPDLVQSIDGHGVPICDLFGSTSNRFTRRDRIGNPKSEP